ncbi:D-hexose-6-phosphate mutarotase [Massilia sp. GCM10020059]|uniref:Putative glucose-6-phosphate 1-epimerase n=1 Tax=Massilia agrisoli TaxID=2892444 RepID=A0ABS8IY27_9BURK|nr:D-hexose-6-phosphate mutarotase [Massilia agrisoli]MCC6073410.1 D-hexose-6-phosphate mutarotase [Massilia agrisoli]
MTAISMVDYGALPAVRIEGPGGAAVIVTLYGAHLVSWKTADGQERIFCSARSSLDGSRAIRGGVPVIFPQFAARGTGMRHGFARVSTWRLVGSGDGFAEFSLAEGDLAPAIAAAWPYSFALALRIEVLADELRFSLEVRNPGAQAFPFAAALHTYFMVDRIANAAIDGVQDGEMIITDKYDHIHFGITEAIVLRSGMGALKLEQQGFPDAVVWNPGAADSAALADMEGDEYQHFVCIEPALVEPIELEAGGIWTGQHQVSVIAA